MAYPVDVILQCRNSIVREGLTRILSEAAFNVVRSCSQLDDLAALPDAIAGGSPQLIVLDNATDPCDADVISDLCARFPQSQLVMLTDQFDLQVMLEAFRLGVRAYIVKEISCERLVGTLRLVAMGERVLPPQLADELQSRPNLVAAPDVDKSADTAALSDREREILRWLIMGCPNKVISRRMEISEATVKVHVKAVLRKLSVKNRTQAAIWAANHGMRGRCFDVETNPMIAVPDATVIHAPAINGQLIHI